MAFTFRKHLVFLDIFQFMRSSLEKLADNLPENTFKFIAEVFKNEQKGVNEAKRCLSS